MRFDGLRFRLFQPLEPTAATDTVALEIAPDAGGALWARLRRAAFVRYHNGAFERRFRAPGRPRLVDRDGACRNDGAMLVADARPRPVPCWRAGRVETGAGGAAALPRSFVISVAQTPDGDIWMGTRDAGLVRVQRAVRRPITEACPTRRSIAWSPDGRDRLWIGTDDGIARWDGQRVTRGACRPALDRVRVTAMIKDRDANVWVGTAGRAVAPQRRRRSCPRSRVQPAPA